MPEKKATKLTQGGVESLNPPAIGREEHWDSLLPGFGLRVSHTGRKTWMTMYRVGGKQVRETIGTLATIPNVGVARAKARASMEKAAAGLNPVTERREIAAKELRQAEEAAATSAANQRDAFENVVDEFMDRFMRHGKRPHSPRYITEVRRNFDRHVLPRWRGRNIRSITRRDINDLLDAIVDEGWPIAANRTLASIRKLFNWSIGRGILETSPVAMIQQPSAEAPRDRALNPEEIRTLWAATEALKYPFGPFFRLLLATGQRRSEVATMRWADLDRKGEKTWTIPAEMTKAKRTHVVPLSPLALNIIEECDREQQLASPYVFSSRAKRPIAGYSKAKQELDEVLAACGDIPPWRIHDLRRSAATRMAEKMKVTRFVIARVLNHADSGVTAGYDQHDYLPEKRDALDKWGSYLDNLIRPTPADNLVQLRPAGEARVG
jgi:integrase